MLFLFALFLICGFVEQLAEARFVGDLDLDKPTGLVGIVGQMLKVLGQRRVDLDDLAVDGAVEVADGFDRFDLAEGLAGVELSAHRGQIDKNQVREGFVGEGGAPDDGDPAAGRIGLDADPFVRLAIHAILRHYCCGPFRVVGTLRVPSVVIWTMIDVFRRRHTACACYVAFLWRQ